MFATTYTHTRTRITCRTSTDFMEGTEPGFTSCYDTLSVGRDAFMGVGWSACIIDGPPSRAVSQDGMVITHLVHPCLMLHLSYAGTVVIADGCRQTVDRRRQKYWCYISLQGDLSGIAVRLRGFGGHRILLFILRTGHFELPAPGFRLPSMTRVVSLLLQPHKHGVTKYKAYLRMLHDLEACRSLPARGQGSPPPRASRGEL